MKSELDAKSVAGLSLGAQPCTRTSKTCICRFAGDLLADSARVRGFGTLNTRIRPSTSFGVHRLLSK